MWSSSTCRSHGRGCRSRCTTSPGRSGASRSVPPRTTKPPESVYYESSSTSSRPTEGSSAGRRPLAHSRLALLLVPPHPRDTIAAMWLALALAAALFQVLRNTAMKRLGHALDEYINVWGRFAFLLPWALATAVLTGWPPLKPGFYAWGLALGVFQTLPPLALSNAVNPAEILVAPALWKGGVLILLRLRWR